MIEYEKITDTQTDTVLWLNFMQVINYKHTNVITSKLVFL
jgi:hypothetical protein